MRPIIPPKSFFEMPARQAKAIDKALDDGADIAKEMLLRPTRTWNTIPKFNIKKTPQGREVFTVEKPYLFLTRGTRVRYATMTPGFIPKTGVRVLGSGPGAGGVMYISKKHPRPGIKAREWEEMVTEEMNKKMPKIVNDEIAKVL